MAGCNGAPCNKLVTALIGLIFDVIELHSLHTTVSTVTDRIMGVDFKDETIHSFEKKISCDKKLRILFSRRERGKAETFQYWQVNKTGQRSLDWNVRCCDRQAGIIDHKILINNKLSIICWPH